MASGLGGHCCSLKGNLQGSAMLTSGHDFVAKLSLSTSLDTSDIEHGASCRRRLSITQAAASRSRHSTAITSEQIVQEHLLVHIVAFLLFCHQQSVRKQQGASHLTSVEEKSAGEGRPLACWPCAHFYPPWTPPLHLPAALSCSPRSPGELQSCITLLLRVC